jgi:hypothetical protein
MQVAVVAVAESPTELMFQLPQVRLLSSPMAQVAQQELPALDPHLLSVVVFTQQAAVAVVPLIRAVVPVLLLVQQEELELQRVAVVVMVPEELRRMVAWVRPEPSFQSLALQLCMEQAAVAAVMTELAV